MSATIARGASPPLSATLATFSACIADCPAITESARSDHNTRVSGHRASPGCAARAPKPAAPTNSAHIAAATAITGRKLEVRRPLRIACSACRTVGTWGRSSTAKASRQLDSSSSAGSVDRLPTAVNMGRPAPIRSNSRSSNDTADRSTKCDT